MPTVENSEISQILGKIQGGGVGGGGGQGFQEKIVRGPTILGLLHFC
jgi:hypothetical protein